MVAHALPVHRCAALLESLTGATPSVGFVHATLTQAAAAMEQTDQRIHTLITLAYAVCCDETPIRVGPRTPQPGQGRKKARKKADKSRQRALVLGWIEESFGSKEPVDPAALTIEHVLPQTPTASWNTAVAADLGPDESIEEVYEALVHTLGNLTLTGYNAELSNADFAVKRQRLAASGIALNKEIAERDR